MKGLIVQPENENDTWTDRLDRVQGRLGDLARPLLGSTSPDPATGERWEAGDDWGHLSEFVGFWLPQVVAIVANYVDEPLPIGRPPESTSRTDAISYGKGASVGELWAKLQRDLVELRAFLNDLDPNHPARGNHP